MRYLCLIYGDPKVWEAKGQHEVDRIVSDHFDFDADLGAKGILLASEALQPPATATMVRMRDGRISATDGPFAETKEELGGFYLIEAGDLDEAIDIAGHIPSARWGAIEVRPIRILSRPATR